MSQDIRSFFTVMSKKSSPNVSTPATKKRPKRLIDSDDDDVVEVTPRPKVAKKQPEKKKEVVNSNSEGHRDTPKLKTVDISDVFKKSPIKQSKVEPKPKPAHKVEVKKDKKSKKKKNTELGIHGDSKFEQTLSVLDEDDDIFEDIDLLEKTATEALLQLEPNNDKEKETEHKPTNERKRSRTDSEGDKKTPKKPKKFEHTDSGIDPGQEAHERKRYMAMNYKNYLNRSGPKNHGLKELPKGKPTCLNGLCFLRTGVLDSLEGEEFDNLVKEHGGRTVHSVSKKVNYVVVGEEPGPAKLEKAENYNIPRISEDELLDLILTKSGKEAKYCKKDASGSSDDLGVVMDEQPEKKEKIVTAIDVKIAKKDKSPKDKHVKKEKSRENGEKSSSKDNLKLTPHKQNEEKSSSKDNLKLTSHKQNEEKSSSKNNLKFSTQKQNDKPSSITTDPSALSFVDRYKPLTVGGIIGQQGEGSNLHKLKKWLENWYKNQDPKVKKNLIKPSPWARKDDGAYFKCALLSGPPGVGKTTTATLVAKELGLDIVEFNASDTRSKKLLNQEVKSLLSSNTISGFASGQSHVNKKRVLLMDEVDGMAGNEDRGGIQELIQLIKHSSIPIICMCNDRNHQKMRSLLNYCYDLKFSPPKLEQLKGAMMSVCCRENINLNSQALVEIITRTKCDVRQTLNHLALLKTSDKDISVEEARRGAEASKKDTVMGPWEVCRAVFTKSEHKDMTVADKARLFFFDYSLGPLFVQENYLKVQPDGCDKNKSLLKATFSADAISMGDIIDSKIRRSNNWSLLESQAFFSSVLPGHHMSGAFTKQIDFPGWLGKNSKKNKFKRLVSEIQVHTRTSASASKLAVKLDYIVPLRNAIVLPLKQKGLEGIDEAVSVMKAYNLLREDVDSLVELCQWTHGENPMSSVDSKVKSSFTRAYNKQVTLLPYAPMSGISKKKATAAESDLLGDTEVVASDTEEEDDITKNSMIKVKKHTAKGKGKKNEEAGTSKKNETKKGKAKKK